ncbi:unnamed protein product, partial [Dracunculus medinensis]|uniref:RRM domain-containing protein n=1 Tax=Dracunculus medinensis TaxID=318479 RepID=A0A0N4UGF8_DRAME
GRSFSRSRSRSDSHSRHSRSRRSRTPRRGYDNGSRSIRREEPEPSRCLGVFGLSLYTTERDLKEIFEKYGELEKAQLVFDHPSRRSRGFGFVYFKNLEDAIYAKERIVGTEIDGHRVRVDFSLTKRAHTPTPGIYMGSVDGRRRAYRSAYWRYYGYDGDRYSPVYRGRYDYRRRSPSPRYYDYRRRHRSRSYDRDRY